LEDTEIDLRVILKWILIKFGWIGMHWIHLAQDRLF
jgi:hypothetical protein